MPVRYIATRLAIEGEKEYRDAVAHINSELKTLDSQLKVVASQFKDSANTQEALKAKSEALNDLYSKQSDKLKEMGKALTDAQKAVNKYTEESNKLKASIDENEAKLNDLKNSSSDTADEQQRLTDANKKLNEELDTSNSYLRAAERGVNGWQTQINSAQIKLNNLDAEIQDNNRYLEEAAQSADGVAASIDQYGNKIKDAGEKTQGANKALEALAAILVAAGIQKTAKEIADALHECFDASVEFESGFAGVKKTVDGTDEELEKLKDGIKNMSLEIPVATTEINEVAEAAGQLGIKVSDIESFTRVMLDLGVSTNLSAGEAASALAKFANITKMSADDYERLGSTIVALGNNFATTESDIVSMATRLASTGAVVGLTEPQIMAVATALSSVGIEAEAGGSAISKLLKQIETSVQTYEKANKAIDSTGYSLRELELMSANNSKDFKALADSIGLTSTQLNKYISNAKKLEQFAEISGKTADEFIQAWGDDAVKALDMFISGLSTIDRTGGSAVSVLEEMGLTEVRLSNAVLALASSNGILTQSVDLANGAWAENVALANEAAQRYATTESKFEIFRNSVNLLKIAIGDDLTGAMGDLAESGTDVTVFMTDFIEKNEWAVPAVTALTVALGVFVTGVTAAMAIKKLTALLFDFTNPATGMVLAIGGIVAALTALSAYVTLLPKVTDEYDQFNESLNKTTEESKQLIQAAQDLKVQYEEQKKALGETNAITLSLISELQTLSVVENKSAADKAAIVGIIKELNSVMPDLNLYYDEQNDIITKNTGEILENADALYELFNAQMKQEEYRLASEHLYETLKKQKELEKQLEEQRAKVNEATEKYTKITAEADEYTSQFTGAVEKNRQYFLKYGIAVNESKQNLNEATDAIDLLKTELSKNASELRKAEDAVNSLADASHNTASAVEDAGEAIAETGEKTVESTEEMQLAISALDDQMKELQKAYDSAYKSAYSSISSQHKLFSGVSLTYETTAKATKKVSDAQNVLKQELSETQSVLKNLQSEYDSAYKSAYSGINSQYKLFSGISDLMKDIAAKSKVVIELEPTAVDFEKELETVTKALDDLQSEYDSVYNAAYNSLNGQTKLFAEQSESVTKSVDQMLESMRSQAVNIREYAADLQMALGAGFNKDVLSDLADGSAQSKAYLSSIANEYRSLVGQYGEDSEEVRRFVDNFNSTFEDTQKAKDAFASTVAEMQTEFSQRAGELEATADELRKNVTEPFEETSEAIPDLIDAITSGMKEQAAGIAEYTKLLEDAADAGFSEGFVKTLSDGSADSQLILGALMDKYNELIGTFGEGGDEVQTFVNDFNSTFEETEKAKDIFASTVAEMQTDFSTVAEVLIAKVEELSLKVVDSSTSTAAAVETIAKSSAQLVGEMLKSMEDDSNSIIEKIELLDWAAKSGFEKGFVTTLADGSEDSKAYLNAIKDEYQKLVDRFGESSAEVQAFVEDFNEKFKGVEEAEKTWSDTWGKIYTEYEEKKKKILSDTEELAKEIPKKIKLDENEIRIGLMPPIESAVKSLKELAKSEGAKLGSSIAQGIASGITGSSHLIGKSMTDASWAGSNAYKKADEISSPSKKYQRLAAFIPEGIALGIENNIHKIEEASLKMSAALENNFNRVLPELPDFDNFADRLNYSYADQSYNRNSAVPFAGKIEIPVYLNDREIARAVGQAEYDRNTSASRNRGR